MSPGESQFSEAVERVEAGSSARICSQLTHITYDANEKNYVLHTKSVEAVGTIHDIVNIAHGHQPICRVHGTKSIFIRIAEDPVSMGIALRYLNVDRNLLILHATKGHIC